MGLKIANQLRRERKIKNKRKWGGVHGKSVLLLENLPRIPKSAKKKINTKRRK